MARKDTTPEDTAPPQEEQLDGMPELPVDQLPLFDGFRLSELEIAFGGSTTLRLRREDVRALYDAARLREHVRITVAVGEHEPFDLDASVVQKTVKLKSMAGVEGVKVPVQVVRVQVEGE